MSRPASTYPRQGPGWRAEGLVIRIRCNSTQSLTDNYSYYPWRLKPLPRGSQDGQVRHPSPPAQLRPPGRRRRVRLRQSAGSKPFWLYCLPGKDRCRVGAEVAGAAIAGASVFGRANDPPPQPVSFGSDDWPLISQCPQPVGWLSVASRLLSNRAATVRSTENITTPSPFSRRTTGEVRRTAEL